MLGSTSMQPAVRLRSRAPGIFTAGALLMMALAFASGVRAAPTEVTSTPRPGLRIGGIAPALDTQRVSGTDGVSLDALRGRVVVLDFWAPWCGPCRMIMPSLDQLSTRYHGRGLTVLGVARESRADIEDHLARSPVGYTIARDLGRTMTDYGVRAIPMLVVIDRRGTVRDIVTGVGDDSMSNLDALVATLVAEPTP
jgi:thiol-disulfide isomerase/thioredoxin